MKIKPAWIALSAGLIILIGVIVLIVVTANKPITTEASTTEQVKVEKTLSGKSVAEDKQDILTAAVGLLDTVEAPKDATEFESYMQKIESGEVPVPEELKAKIRLVDSLATEEGIERTIYQTLVTFATFSKQSTGNDKVSPLYEDAASGIILDQEVGVAYVPTTLFVNSGTGVNGFSMEFIYVDGEWLFSPYMTLDELRLALVLQGEGTTANG